MNARPLKLTTIGDKDIGITSFLMTFATGEYPTGYVPVLFENNVMKILVDGKEFALGVWETSGVYNEFCDCYFHIISRFL